MSEDGFSTVRLRNDLVDLVDKVVEAKKDEFDRLQFRSRADFVAQACERFLKDLRKEAKK